MTRQPSKAAVDSDWQVESSQDSSFFQAEIKQKGSKAFWGKDILILENSAPLPLSFFAPLSLFVVSEQQVETNE